MVNAQLATLIELMKAHNIALRKRQNAYAAAGPNLMAPCMGNVCLNFPQPNRTPNQKRLRANAQKANREYNAAYNRLKRALRQNVWINTNNMYAANRPPNYRRMTTNTRWNIGPVRAARTIQRHVRGTQLRARAGAHNPRTPVGHVLLMKRIMRNMKG